MTLAGVVVFVFLLTHILPSNPAALRAGPLADAELIHKYEREMGLDQPIYVQFARYAQETPLREPRRELEDGSAGARRNWAQRLPATLELAATAFLMALVVGVTLGVLAAVYAGTWIDQGVRLYATLGAAQALFWLALLWCTSSTTRWVGRRRRSTA